MPDSGGQRIGIFGGTFDPIHEAHLRIAEEARKRYGLDRVLFVPAAHPPHKEDAGVSPYEDRFHMVELACAGHAGFEASRLEEGAGRSYTVDTLRRVCEQMRPGDALFFLIGSDAFHELETWKDWREVARLTEFIVASRPGAEYDLPEGARVLRLDGVELPVSSSEIRARLAAGEPTPELPTGVRAFVEERGLYGASKKATASP